MAPLFVSEPCFLFLIHSIVDTVDINKVLLFIYFFCYTPLLMIRRAEHSPCAVDVFSCHFFSWLLFYLDPVLCILGDTANQSLPEHQT